MDTLNTVYQKLWACQSKSGNDGGKEPLPGTFSKPMMLMKVKVLPGSAFLHIFIDREQVICQNS